MKKWSREIYALQQKPMEGIRLVVQEDDIQTIHVLMLGQEGTPFAKGCFKIQMTIAGLDYPQVPPKCTFQTKTFHPNLHPTTGEICVNTLKKDWSVNTSINEILLTIKSLLVDPNPESALNEEAGKMLLDDYTEYQRRVGVLCNVHCRNVLLEYGELDPNRSDEQQHQSENSLKRPAAATATKKKLLKRL